MSTNNSSIGSYNRRVFKHVKHTIYEHRLEKLDNTAIRSNDGLSINEIQHVIQYFVFLASRRYDSYPMEYLDPYAVDYTFIKVQEVPNDKNWIQLYRLNDNKWILDLKIVISNTTKYYTVYFCDIKDEPDAVNHYRTLMSEIGYEGNRTQITNTLLNNTVKNDYIVAYYLYKIIYCGTDINVIDGDITKEYGDLNNLVKWVNDGFTNDKYLFIPTLNPPINDTVNNEYIEIVNLRNSVYNGLMILNTDSQSKNKFIACLRFIDDYHYYELDKNKISTIDNKITSLLSKSDKRDIDLDDITSLKNHMITIGKKEFKDFLEDEQIDIDEDGNEKVFDPSDLAQSYFGCDYKNTYIRIRIYDKMIAYFKNNPNQFNTERAHLYTKLRDYYSSAIKNGCEEENPYAQFGAQNVYNNNSIDGDDDVIVSEREEELQNSQWTDNTHEPGVRSSSESNMRVISKEEHESEFGPADKESEAESEPDFEPINTADVDIEVDAVQEPELNPRTDKPPGFIDYVRNDVADAEADSDNVRYKYKGTRGVSTVNGIEHINTKVHVINSLLDTRPVELTLPTRFPDIKVGYCLDVSEIEAALRCMFYIRSIEYPDDPYISYMPRHTRYYRQFENGKPVKDDVLYNTVFDQILDDKPCIQIYNPVNAYENGHWVVDVKIRDKETRKYNYYNIDSLRSYTEDYQEYVSYIRKAIFHFETETETETETVFINANVHKQSNGIICGYMALYYAYNIIVLNKTIDEIEKLEIVEGDIVEWVNRSMVYKINDMEYYNKTCVFDKNPDGSLVESSIVTRYIDWINDLYNINNMCLKSIIKNKWIDFITLYGFYEMDVTINDKESDTVMTRLLDLYDISDEYSIVDYNREIRSILEWHLDNNIENVAYNNFKNDYRFQEYEQHSSVRTIVESLDKYKSYFGKNYGNITYVLEICACMVEYARIIGDTEMEIYFRTVFRINKENRYLIDNTIPVHGSKYSRNYKSKSKNRLKQHGIEIKRKPLYVKYIKDVKAEISADVKYLINKCVDIFDKTFNLVERRVARLEKTLCFKCHRLDKVRTELQDGRDSILTFITTNTNMLWRLGASNYELLDNDDIDTINRLIERLNLKKGEVTRDIDILIENNKLDYDRYKTNSEMYERVGQLPAYFEETYSNTIQQIKKARYEILAERSKRRTSYRDNQIKYMYDSMDNMIKNLLNIIDDMRTKDKESEYPIMRDGVLDKLYEDHVYRKFIDNITNGAIFTDSGCYTHVSEFINACNATLRGNDYTPTTIVYNADPLFNVILRYIKHSDTDRRDSYNNYIMEFFAKNKAELSNYIVQYGIPDISSDNIIEAVFRYLIDSASNEKFDLLTELSKIYKYIDYFIYFYAISNRNIKLANCVHSKRNYSYHSINIRYLNFKL